MNINKTMVAPIVAGVCLFIGTVTGHPIGQTVQDEWTTIIVAGVAFGGVVYGIWKNHRK
jgi:hypothetical protein